MRPPLLISGDSGLVGSHFVKKYNDEFRFESLNLDVGVDITNRVKVFETIKKSQAKAMIHLAAFTDVSRAYQETDNTDGLVYKVNVVGTQNVAQACQKFNKYLIHISTDFVFDGSKKTAYTEKDQPNPIEWYGKTKYLAEQEVQKINSPWAIFRIAFPYRAQFAGKLDLVRKLIKGLKEDSLYPQWDDVLITPTLVDDITQALYLAIKDQPTGTFHCVGSTSVSPYQMAQMIAEVFKLDKSAIKKGSFKEFLKKDPRPRQQYLNVDNSKLEAELGMSFHQLKEGLQIIKNQGVIL